MIDFHAHIDLFRDPVAVAGRVDQECEMAICVTTSPRAWLIARQRFSRFRHIRVAVGLHPDLVAKRYTEVDLLLSAIGQSGYVGEVGVDGSLVGQGVKHLQTEVLHKVLHKCEAVGGRVISIHSRNAVGEVLNGIKKYQACGRPILHWFSGSRTQLREAIDAGCFFSVNMAMINSAHGKSLIEYMPLDRILLESDSPFVKINGNVVCPWECSLLLTNLSQFRKIDRDDFEMSVRRNVVACCGIVEPDIYSSIDVKDLAE